MSCSISNRTRHDLGRDPDVICCIAGQRRPGNSYERDTPRDSFTLPKGREGVFLPKRPARGGAVPRRGLAALPGVLTFALGFWRASSSQQAVSRIRRR